MSYVQTGFRPFYHHFCVLSLNERIFHCLDGFPKAEKANACLTYGYIDNQDGLMLEVIATAKIGKMGIKYFDSTNNLRAVIPIKMVEYDEVQYIDDPYGSLARRYADKIAITGNYAASPGIEITREMEFLDVCRDRYAVDTVFVYLMRGENEREGCWTQITEFEEDRVRRIKGILLEEPKQDFNCHKGDTIAFFAREEQGKTVCLADLDEENRVVNWEDIKDGIMLEMAVQRFSADSSRKNLVLLLAILKNSTVWIPCKAILSERDQQRFNEYGTKLLEEQMTTDDSKSFTTYDEIRLVPDILMNENKRYLPVFATKDVMGQDGNGFSKMEMSMLDAVSMARSHEVDGILLNAFTENMVLGKEGWDILEKIASNAR